MFRRRFANLKVGAKFGVVGLIILPFLLLLGASGVGGAFTINGLIQQLHSDQIPSITSLLSASQSVQTVRFYQLQALVDTNGAKSQQDAALARQNLQSARIFWSEYLTTPVSDEEEVLIRQFEADWQAWSASVNTSLTNLAGHTAQDNQTILSNLSNDTTSASGQALFDTLNKLVQINQNDATDEAAQGQATFWLVVAIIVVVALVITTVSLGAIYVLARSITNPLKKLQTATQRIANGDLSGQVEIESRDEIGTLATTFNATLVALRQLVGQLLTQSQKVTQATGELTVQATSQVTAISQQSSAIGEATQTLRQLRGTAQDIASQAAQASQVVQASVQQVQAVSSLADEMAKAQEQGRATVIGTLKAISGLKEQMQAIQEQQDSLVGQSTVIKQVTTLLEGISKETHLLALNAAVEAAGAGEYGERFRVVAQEVKQLAVRAGQATQEVSVALGSISVAVEQATNMIKTGLHEAEQAVGEAEHSDNTFVTLAELAQQVKLAARDIVKEVEGNAVLTTNIGTSTREQEVANNQMVQTMLEIEAVTAQNLNSVRQGEIATSQLSTTAQELREAAGAFKLVTI